MINRNDYQKEQGWGTMPDEEDHDSRVAKGVVDIVFEAQTLIIAKSLSGTLHQDE